MGDLRIITNSKLRELASKGSNFRNTMSINWNKCKREIEIGLDLSIERIVSTNPKVTKWKSLLMENKDSPRRYIYFR